MATGPKPIFLRPGLESRTIRRPDVDRNRPDTGPLCVGRERELAILSDLYEAASEGERLALVEGPSGSGKSRILQGFRSQIRLGGGVVLEGRCEQGAAFGPLATVVDRAIRFLADMGRSPTIDLADLGCSDGCHRFWHQHDHRNAGMDTGGSREAHERRLRFFDAIRGLLQDISRVRTPVVILHELERADEGTLQFLRFLFEGSGPWTAGVSPERSLKTLFVASLRSDIDGDRARLEALRSHDAATLIELGPLDARGVRAFLQSEETISRVLARTGGMPDAIERLLEAELLEPGDLLARRLAELPEGARDLLEALSVLGHPAQVEILCELTEQDPAGPGVAALSGCELIDRQLLDRRVRVAFSRDQHRELVYQGLDDERRRALHRRCAAVFAERPGLEMASLHALRAGDFAEAVPLALDEARGLAARHGHAEAAALLERVVAAAPDDVVSADLRQQLAELYRVVGDYRRALVHAEAVRVARPNSANATHRVGRLLTLSGELDQASVVLQEAHALALESDDATTRCTVETLLAELFYLRAAYDDAEEWAARALADARDLSLEIHARNTLGKVALVREEAAAAEYFEVNRAKAAEAALGHQEAQALTNLGVAMLRRQELARAKECFSDAIRVATEANDSRDVAIATENLAVLAHLRRDYREALDHYHHAVALLKRLGNREMLTRVGNNLGELYLSLGDVSRARALCDFAQHMGGVDLSTVRAAQCMRLRGRIEIASGRGDRGRASLETAYEMLTSIGSNLAIDPLLELARLSLEEGDVPAVRRLLADSPAASSPKRAAEVAIVAADLERAAGGDEVGAARRAVELAEAADDEEILLEAWLRAARVACDLADIPAAERALDTAREVEARLTARVPEANRETWTARRARADLTLIEARVGTLAPRTRRTSSFPVAPRARNAEQDARYPNIAGSAPGVLQMLEVIDKVAPSDAIVLVRGESGTGKELVADALHRGSSRRDKPLVKVNCAALVETLLLSELFGHERGAFTGANARKKGRFELADGGTLFLDEIGDISAKTQVALLRVLQEREFERVGGTQSLKVDVRIICATHRDLEKMVAEGTFREDLYYRLRGVTIEVPSLRDRKSDLRELCEKLLMHIADERDESPKGVSPAVLEVLARHSWPGNIRELDNVLRSASLFSENEALQVVDFAALDNTFGRSMPDQEVESTPISAQPLEEAIYERLRGGEDSLLELKKTIERECIVRALSESDGNITRAAELLGMKRPRLSQLVKQYGLEEYKRLRS